MIFYFKIKIILEIFIYEFIFGLVLCIYGYRSKKRKDYMFYNE